MAEAYFTMMDRIHDSDNIEDHLGTPVGIPHLDAATHVPSRYPDGGENDSRLPEEGIGNYQLPMTEEGPSAVFPSGPPVTQYSFNPEGPEDPRPESLQDSVEREMQPAQATVRAIPSLSFLLLNFSPADVDHLSQFLLRPVETYTRVVDLRAEISQLSMERYTFLKAGLSTLARQKVQRLRRCIPTQQRDRNVTQTERDSLNQQLIQSQLAALVLERELDQLRRSYNQVCAMIGQLQQTNDILLNFCHGKLQRQGMAIHGLATQMQQGMRIAPPPPGLAIPPPSGAIPPPLGPPFPRSRQP